ncbi:unnamed protein product [Pedinophyceae sp. YPF-701]|nr:unnamed protein product [Pedinophyceae sp. YPF-701]
MGLQHAGRSLMASATCGAQSGVVSRQGIRTHGCVGAAIPAPRPRCQHLLGRDLFRDRTRCARPLHVVAAGESGAVSEGKASGGRGRGQGRGGGRRRSSSGGRGRAGGRGRGRGRGRDGGRKSRAPDEDGGQAGTARSEKARGGRGAKQGPRERRGGRGEQRSGAGQREDAVEARSEVVEDENAAVGVDDAGDISRELSENEAAAQEGGARVLPEEPRKSPEEVAVEEGLELLEWNLVSRQVAFFARTPLAFLRLLRGGLPLGGSLAESRALLRETAEARALLAEHSLSLHKVYDILPAIAAARKGAAPLSPLQLRGVMWTLAAAQEVLRCVGAAEDGEGRYPSVRRMLAAVGVGEPSGAVRRFLEETERCVGGGMLKSDASEGLAIIRADRAANSQKLRAAMDAWAQELHRRGVSERAQVVIRRDRLCVPVRAGRQGDVCPGSVVLGQSGSGATLFVEPGDVVDMNNEETELEALEREEEHRILTYLSELLAECGDDAAKYMDLLTNFDIACARARHAAWIGGQCPELVEDDSGEGRPAVHVPAVYHPLLLEPALDALPQAPPQLIMDFNTDFLGQGGLDQDVDVARPDPAAGAAGGGHVRDPSKMPRPVALTVPAGTKVVAVTGPNTGGKTAALKTLGVCALMAKAGLFLPTDASSGDGEPPRIAWFDRVLVDIGDSQSLQQSLSTFSGHVKRLARVLAHVTDSSLALLDEVGSGTDPVEGSALAASVLEALRDRAALTVATTHHAEIKDLATTEPEFVNASVEFDVETLRPTYRMMWGETGASNALNIAKTLGFDSTVIAEARELVDNPASLLHDDRRNQAGMEQSLKEQLESGEAERQALQAAVATLDGDIARLRSEEAAAQQRLETSQNQASQLQSSMDEDRGELQWIVDAVREGELSLEDAEVAISELQARWAAEAGGGESELEDVADDEDAWAPTVGMKVSLVNMGGSIGEVLSRDGGGTYTVRAGMMVVEARVADMAPLDGLGDLQPRKVKASKMKRYGGSGSSSAGGGKSTGGGGLMMQTSQNTLDLRGKRVAEALDELDLALGRGRQSGAALYVIHGHGSGAVKKAVQEALKKHRAVERTEADPQSAGGCTVAIFR